MVEVVDETPPSLTPLPWNAWKVLWLDGGGAWVVGCLCCYYCVFVALFDRMKVGSEESSPEDPSTLTNSIKIWFEKVLPGFCA